MAQGLLPANTPSPQSALAAYRHKYCAIEVQTGKWKRIVRCQTVSWKILWTKDRFGRVPGAGVVTGVVVRKTKRVLHAPS
jgi:hypothetical protein